MQLLERNAAAADDKADLVCPAQRQLPAQRSAHADGGRRLTQQLAIQEQQLHAAEDIIIRHGRILGAGCMLPLSKNVNLSRDLGMRHRAGIGMSENSDAVVVIVSEETGSISVAIGGMLKRHLMPETLSKLLRNELMPQPEELEDKPRRSLADLLGLRRKEGDNGAEE